MRLQLGKIAPLAVGHMLGTVFTNMSLGKVAVSFTHTIKASEPFFTVVLSALFLGEVRHPLAPSSHSHPPEKAKKKRTLADSAVNGIEKKQEKKKVEPMISFHSMLGMQVPSLPVLGSLVPIVGGVALASFTEVSFNWSVMPATALPICLLENLWILL